MYDRPLRERVDAGLVGIDAYASESGADDRDGHRQADVPEPDDPHLAARCDDPVEDTTSLPRR
jgi:hypothetical protein